MESRTTASARGLSFCPKCGIIASAIAAVVTGFAKIFTLCSLLPCYIDLRIEGLGKPPSYIYGNDELGARMDAQLPDFIWIDGVKHLVEPIIPISVRAGIVEVPEPVAWYH